MNQASSASHSDFFNTLVKQGDRQKDGGGADQRGIADRCGNGEDGVRLAPGEAESADSHDDGEQRNGDMLEPMVGRAGGTRR